MFTPHIVTLSIGDTVPLLVHVATPDSVIRWRRVGLISRTDARLRVDFDAAAAGFLPAWETCVAASVKPAGELAPLRFGIFRGRAGVVVIASAAVTPRVRRAMHVWARELAAMRATGEPGAVPQRRSRMRAPSTARSRVTSARTV